MNTTNKIKVSITKAEITRIAIEVPDYDQVPNIYISGKYLTDTNKKVGEFIFYSNHYQDDSKIEIPPSLHMDIAQIFREMSSILQRKMNSIDKLIAPVESKGNK